MRAEDSAVLHFELVVPFELVVIVEVIEVVELVRAEWVENADELEAAAVVVVVAGRLEYVRLVSSAASNPPVVKLVLYVEVDGIGDAEKVEVVLEVADAVVAVELGMAGVEDEDEDEIEDVDHAVKDGLEQVEIESAVLGYDVLEAKVVGTVEVDEYFDAAFVVEDGFDHFGKFPAKYA